MTNALMTRTALSIIDTTAEVVSTTRTPVSNPRTGKVIGSVKSRRGDQVMDAHREWARRPADEAVFSFEDLLARTSKVRESSRELEPQKWEDMRVEVRGDDLALVGPKDGALLNNWTANRLANIVSAPADYIERLPTELAAQCLNHGLAHQSRRKGELEILSTNGRARALTSERYERVWDHEIASLAHELHTKGTWGACEAFRSAEVSRVAHAWSDSKPLPLGWVGDRSSFIALADYEGAVEVNGTKLARFALLSNSEVGAASFKIVFGLMDFACANFILWGTQNVTEVKVRHTGSIRERFQELTAPMTARLTSGDRDDIVGAARLASRTLIADTQANVLTKVAAVTKLPKPVVAEAWSRAEATPRYGDPRSVWGMLSGLTETSQHVAEHADKRIAMDDAAARLMTLI
jgi:hypothetical protein